MPATGCRVASVRQWPVARQARPLALTKDNLFIVIDALWAELPVATIRALEQESPAMVATCRAVHRKLWPHEDGDNE